MFPSILYARSRAPAHHGHFLTSPIDRQRSRNSGPRPVFDISDFSAEVEQRHGNIVRIAAQVPFFAVSATSGGIRIVPAQGDVHGFVD